MSIAWLPAVITPGLFPSERVATVTDVGGVDWAVIADVGQVDLEMSLVEVAVLEVGESGSVLVQVPARGSSRAVVVDGSRVVTVVS